MLVELIMICTSWLDSYVLVSCHPKTQVSSYNHKMHTKMKGIELKSLCNYYMYLIVRYDKNELIADCCIIAGEWSGSKLEKHLWTGRLMQFHYHCTEVSSEPFLVNYYFLSIFFNIFSFFLSFKDSFDASMPHWALASGTETLSL